jgi:DNA (cytosine-5)-methyltransferase 1
MSAYYNENDPRAAAWLRELIKQGAIADGEVDERSIEDIQPADVAGFTQCHFFAGIGGWSYALRLAGWPDDREVWTGSCPCQPFSEAGAKRGTADSRHLWPEFFRLIGECRPSTVFGEQVASKDGLAWLDIVSLNMESANYAIAAADLCAAGVKAPHIRQRLYFVAHDSSKGLEIRQLESAWQERPPAKRSGKTFELALTEGEQHNRRGNARVGRREPSNGSGLVDTTGEQARLPGRARQSRGAEAGELVLTDSRGWPTRGEATAANGHGRTPLTASRWSDCEWIECIDGKSRPVEPGTFPLAHGIPARMGRLRGYGNALVPQVAAEFIGAYMDTQTTKQESEHSVFAFSASPRWISCAGSMAYPENTEEGVDGGVYADEGTAAHTLATVLLKSKSGMTAEDWIGKVIRGGKREFEVTEEFAGHVQTYVDDVQRRAIGGYLMVEQRVTLEGVEGFDETNYGTSDAIIALPSYGVVEDLKFGMGEKVYAWIRADKASLFTMETYGSDGSALEVEPNYQLMMYALAALADLCLLVDKVAGIQIVINQPRIGNLSELWVPITALERFAVFAADALSKSMLAMGLGVRAVEAKAGEYLNPGEKQCRWCRALARCPAAVAKVQKELSADFDTIETDLPAVAVDPKRLAKAMAAVPFVSDWCRAVMAKANELVAAGTAIIGPDGKPYKFVEGGLGDRKWADEKAAEAALTGVLGENAYQPKKILTASGAAKVLDKKKTAETWKDVFVPLIKRAAGKPMLVMGSDPRAPFSPAAESDEFEDVDGEVKSRKRLASWYAIKS